jgi:alpha-beta hydrolase superfamily lysophospholipase
MREKFPEDTIELIDLPGNGERNQDSSPASVSEFVADLRARSELVKKGERFHILSISLGGMITVEWMRQFPHEVIRSYVMCTSSAGFSPARDRYMLPNYLPTAKVLVAKDEVAREEIVLAMTVNSQERRAAEFMALSAYSQKHPLKTSNLVKQIFAASQYRFPKQAPGDVVLIGSHGDKLVSPRCTLSIGKAWGLPVQMHPWSGHDVALDDPQWLLERLL